MALIHAAKKSHKSSDLGGDAKKAAAGLTADQAHDFMYKVEPKDDEEVAYKEARLRKARRILISVQLPNKDYINKIQHDDPIKDDKQVKTEDTEEPKKKDTEEEEVTKEAALKGFAKMVVNLQWRKD